MLLVLLVLGATLIGFARHHRHARGHWEGPGHTAFQHGLFDDGVMPDGGWRHDWHHGRHHGRGGLANTTGLVGSVVSTGNGTLVVAVDGGNQVTVPTNDRTRVFGAVSAVSGLQPGQRVLVRTGADKTAVAVFVPTARATGTITALDGDKATLTGLDGLTEPLDVSALNPKPKVGDMVAVQGTPADNGATLKAQTLRTLPKAS